MIYILWNNGYPQVGMGYWLKSFNADPPPVPGKSYTVADINNCESIQNNMPCDSNEFSTIGNDRYLYLRVLRLGFAL